MGGYLVHDSHEIERDGPRGAELARRTQALELPVLLRTDVGEDADEAVHLAAVGPAERTPVNGHPGDRSGVVLVAPHTPLAFEGLHRRGERIGVARARRPVLVDHVDARVEHARRTRVDAEHRAGRVEENKSLVERLGEGAKEVRRRCVRVVRGPCAGFEAGVQELEGGFAEPRRGRAGRELNRLQQPLRRRQHRGTRLVCLGTERQQLQGVDPALTGDARERLHQSPQHRHWWPVLLHLALDRNAGGAKRLLPQGFFERHTGRKMPVERRSADSRRHGDPAHAQGAALAEVPPSGSDHGGAVAASVGAHVSHLTGTFHARPADPCLSYGQQFPLRRRERSE